MGFKWRLQSVLDVREKQAQLKRAELFELTAKVEQLQTELTRRKTILSDLIDDLAKEAPKARLEKQGLFMAHAKANDEAIREIEAGIQTLQQQCDEKRTEVIELKKLTEGLGKLRDQAEREFVAEQERQLQSASDEMTTYRFAKERINQKTIEKVNV